MHIIDEPSYQEDRIFYAVTDKGALVYRGDYELGGYIELAEMKGEKVYQCYQQEGTTIVEEVE